MGKRLLSSPKGKSPAKKARQSKHVSPKKQQHGKASTGGAQSSIMDLFKKQTKKAEEKKALKSDPDIIDITVSPEKDQGETTASTSSTSTESPYFSPKKDKSASHFEMTRRSKTVVLPSSLSRLSLKKRAKTLIHVENADQNIEGPIVLKDVNKDKEDRGQDIELCTSSSTPKEETTSNTKEDKSIVENPDAGLKSASSKREINSKSSDSNSKEPKRKDARLSLSLGKRKRSNSPSQSEVKTKLNRKETVSRTSNAIPGRI